ncbi:hypothetical protein HMPREF9420_2776 [Segatella salivae DSM 15606]|uniref:Uncharacterized protein n=1 Tax=Segatella salivae DSM 15606 TaxID=888832 RepID=E6MTF8_9BACT|nr:hypothetical protein HMPREF9420_2776 [Segatella salivae DSM 15606]
MPCCQYDPSTRFRLSCVDPGSFCGHNQSLRIKGNRGKCKECNYLK